MTTILSKYVIGTPEREEMTTELESLEALLDAAPVGIHRSQWVDLVMPYLQEARIVKAGARLDAQDLEKELSKMAAAIYMACPEVVANDISERLTKTRSHVLGRDAEIVKLQGRIDYAQKLLDEVLLDTDDGSPFLARVRRVALELTKERERTQRAGAITEQVRTDCEPELVKLRELAEAMAKDLKILANYTVGGQIASLDAWHEYVKTAEGS
jgi:hypothetical protein